MCREENSLKGINADRTTASLLGVKHLGGISITILTRTPLHRCSKRRRKAEWAIAKLFYWLPVNGSKVASSPGKKTVTVRYARLGAGCALSTVQSHFIDGLEKLGAKYALYCDMGTGWNYSWYRKDDGSVKELFATPGKYTTNWITFYSD